MEMIFALIGIVVGGLTTWWAARYYYEKASRDLAAEANELKRLNTLILRGLESAGLVEYSRDDEGNIRGMVIKAFANLQAGATFSGVGAVAPKQDENSDQ